MSIKKIGNITYHFNDSGHLHREDGPVIDMIRCDPNKTYYTHDIIGLLPKDQQKDTFNSSYFYEGVPFYKEGYYLRFLHSIGKNLDLTPALLSNDEETRKVIKEYLKSEINKNIEC